jgi:hypothetical protein
VLPWLGGLVGVVSTCGVTWQAQQQADDQSAALDHLLTTWTGRRLAGDPERPDLLEARTDYRLVVSWAYQAWTSTADGSEQPPPTSSGTWIPGTDITYSFTTAAAIPDAKLPVEVDLRDESRFDARSVQRYLLGIEPAGGEAVTHFRDDPILVHWSVDHVEALLACYRRVLAFSIKRTDPPPGSAASGAYPYVPLSPTYGSLPADLMAPADARMSAAAAALTCVDLPALGGTTARLDAVLEPRARYDLRVVAAPAGQPDSAEVPVALTNFVASRYAGPADLLAALGLTADEASPTLPQDALITAEPPRGAASLVVGDAALDATLAAIGLDPWPLPARPRVVALWRLDASSWIFDGVLIEADEAVVRPGRLAVDTVTVGAAVLDVVRVSSAGARLLAAPSTPQRLPAETVLEVSLASTTTGLDGSAFATTVRGSRRLLGRPGLVYQEGVSP